MQPGVTAESAEYALRRLIAVTLCQSGFTASSEDALAELQDQTLRLLGGLSHLSHDFAAACNRSRPNAKDVYSACHDQSITLASLRQQRQLNLDACAQDAPLYECFDGPRAPLPLDVEQSDPSKLSLGHRLKQDFQPAQELAAVIPDNLPPLPPSYTYRHTPIYSADPETILPSSSREVRAAQLSRRLESNRQAERSLQNLLRITAGTRQTSLHSAEHLGLASEVAIINYAAARRQQQLFDESGGAGAHSTITRINRLHRMGRIQSSHQSSKADHTLVIGRVINCDLQARLRPRIRPPSSTRIWKPVCDDGKTACAQACLSRSTSCAVSWLSQASTRRILPGHPVIIQWPPDMGNSPSSIRPVPGLPVLSPSDLSELGDVTYERSMGSARCLKTMRARHQHGPIVVKVFVKLDPALSLRSHVKKLRADREQLADVPNVLHYLRLLETEKGAYLTRQWLSSSLYDRISTRPFLADVEKAWMAFQVLKGMRDARERGIAHGDLKLENILLTSYQWVYITDFAPYKPVYLPEDDPSEFSYYFDSSGRRTCYLAPERFYSAGSDIAERRKSGRERSLVTEPMDVFAAGCVIAELYSDGASPFTLSQLFQFKSNDYDPEVCFAEIENTDVRSLVRSMTASEPSARPTFTQCLSSARGAAFPESFYTFLYDFVLDVTALPDGTSDKRDAMAGNQRVLPLRTDSDTRLERIWEDFAAVIDNLTDKARYSSLIATIPGTIDTFPLRLDIPGYEDALRTSMSASVQQHDDPLALVVLNLICANLRNTTRQAAVLHAMDMMILLCQHLSDQAILDRAVPYLISLLEDEVGTVRSAALRSVTQALLLITTITPANASVFTEYIMPHIRLFSVDPEESVRCMYALCLPVLAEQGARHVEMAQAMRIHTQFKLATLQQDAQAPEASYDGAMAELHSLIQSEVTELLSDSSANVKRALLGSMPSLCLFFERHRTNDVLLSHMMTYLNDYNWQLRAAFFESTVGVATCAGSTSVDRYLLPFFIQATSDSEEFVIARSLASLKTMIELDLISRERLNEVVGATLCFLCHPNDWLRLHAASLIASLAQLLPTTEAWCGLYPRVRQLLRSDIADMSEVAILTALGEPLSRAVFEAAITWAARLPRSDFWRSKNKLDALQKRLIASADQDSAQLDKLRQLGMGPNDEIKLLALRDHISKLTTARQNSGDIPYAAHLQLQALGITPQTIFFSTQPCIQPEASASGADKRRITSIAKHVGQTNPKRLSPIGENEKQVKNASSPSVIDLRSGARVASSASATSTTYTAATNITAASSTAGTSEASPTPKRLTSNGIELGHGQPASARDDASADGQLQGGADDATIVSGLAPSTLHGQVGLGAGYRLVTSYEGNDQSIKHLLEELYRSSFKQAVPEFGAPVRPGVPRRRLTRLVVANRDRHQKRNPDNVVAHLGEHTGSINSIAVSPDHIFFCTASDDGTLKVWDTTSIERNVSSKSKYTIKQGGRIESAVVIDGTHCIASVSTHGTLLIHRIDVNTGIPLPRYSRPTLIRSYRIEPENDYATDVVSLQTDSGTHLVFCTASGQITRMDATMMRPLQTWQNPNHYGPPTTICLDHEHVWLAIGTARGFVCLWDMRFGLLIRAWQVTTAGRVTRLQAHAHSSRWLHVAAESDASSPVPALTTWDLATFERSEVLAVASSKSDDSIPASSGLAGQSTTEDAIARWLEMARSDPPDQLKRAVASTLTFIARAEAAEPGVLAISRGDPQTANDALANVSDRTLDSVSTPPAGLYLTAGDDRRLRSWSTHDMQDSYIVSGGDPDMLKPIYVSERKGNLLQHEERPDPSRRTPSRMHRATLIAQYQQTLLKGHQDAITALATAELPFSCVISGDRSGIRCRVISGSNQCNSKKKLVAQPRKASSVALLQMSVAESRNDWHFRLSSSIVTRA
ncbi:uncharacterized protein L969DRAFT_104294 [Mixia osmundae IAM 14324]|uniref:non-specific serine/threonine protein kinase n=1 Tax=Mixia osmundae (strain CBS 9802 / IAM 14324 / JCM 22182 / KY 12970) TaxID=764103 RepID=G7E7L3_MIXOS|nr:uncharacterized protein L969DRAFT_104294 [Mixia osmundae IAM 14324]KEI38425.1 hypothetical protein L969DRAFT_104294 [Mixia osmundae IAM 14324]GAA98823.1 hypothetical protein E5Q_05511 [Mixia osmundae IAM 14324]